MAMTSNNLVIIQSTYDKEALANQVAQKLLEKKLAACIQVEQVTSFFGWEGTIQHSIEWKLSGKTVSKHIETIKNLILSSHSYDLPEFIILPVLDASYEYKNWIITSVS